MDNSGIILIVVGGLIILFNGILNLGNKFGRNRWLSNKLGEGPTRIINGLIGLAIIALGIVMLFNPELFAK